MIILQLESEELAALFRKEINEALRGLDLAKAPPPLPEIGGVELAEALTGYKPSTIYNMVSARTIPHKKRGKRILFRRSELEAWIDAGKRDTTEEAQEKAMDQMKHASGRRAAK